MKKILLLGSLLVLGANTFSETIHTGTGAGEISLNIMVTGSVVAEINDGIEIVATGTSAVGGTYADMKVDIGEVKAGRTKTGSVGEYSVAFKGTATDRTATAMLQKGEETAAITVTTTPVTPLGVTLKYTRTELAATGANRAGKVMIDATATAGATAGSFTDNTVKLVVTIPVA